MRGQNTNLKGLKHRFEFGLDEPPHQSSSGGFRDWQGSTHFTFSDERGWKSGNVQGQKGHDDIGSKGSNGRNTKFGQAETNGGEGDAARGGDASDIHGRLFRNEIDNHRNKGSFDLGDVVGGAGGAGRGGDGGAGSRGAHGGSKSALADGSDGGSGGAGGGGVGGDGGDAYGHTFRDDVDIYLNYGQIFFGDTIGGQSGDGIGGKGGDGGNGGNGGITNGGRTTFASGGDGGAGDVGGDGIGGQGADTHGHVFKSDVEITHNFGTIRFGDVLAGAGGTGIGGKGGDGGDGGEGGLAIGLDTQANGGDGGDGGTGGDGVGGDGGDAYGHNFRDDVGIYLNYGEIFFGDVIGGQGGGGIGGTGGDGGNGGNGGIAIGGLITLTNGGAGGTGGAGGSGFGGIGGIAFGHIFWEEVEVETNYGLIDFGLAFGGSGGDGLGGDGGTGGAGGDGGISIGIGVAARTASPIVQASAGSAGITFNTVFQSDVEIKDNHGTIKLGAVTNHDDFDILSNYGTIYILDVTDLGDFDITNNYGTIHFLTEADRDEVDITGNHGAIYFGETLWA